MVFKIKRNEHGAVEKYKARFVAKGSAQIESLDYGETFASTSSLETFQIVLAAQHDLHLEQLDVESAFSHGKIDNEVYIEQPEGYQGKAEVGTKLVCKLNKPIYCLKQACKTGRIDSKTS